MIERDEKAPLYRRVEPLSEVQFELLSAGLREYAHDANNALAAAFAANELASTGAHDDRQRQRLNRITRQLGKIQALFRRAQSLAWQPSKAGNTVSGNYRELNVLADRCQMTMQWPGADDLRQLAVTMGGSELFYVLRATINNASHFGDNQAQQGGVLSLSVGDADALFSLSFSSGATGPRGASGTFLQGGQLGIGFACIAVVAARANLAVHASTSPVGFSLRFVAGNPSKPALP